MRRFLSFSLLLACPLLVSAEVSHVSDAGFVSEHALILTVPPARAYEALTDEVAEWWDAQHSYSLDARSFSLDARAGGCFCEEGDSVSVEHMRVVFAQTGKTLVMHGGLGPLQSMSVDGVMTFAFTPHDSGTQLKYRYVVHGFVPGGLAAMAEPVDQVQLGQLKRLQAYLATGKSLNP